MLRTDERTYGQRGNSLPSTNKVYVCGGGGYKNDFENLNFLTIIIPKEKLMGVTTLIFFQEGQL